MDCDAGVLHVPVKHVLLDQYMEAETMEALATLQPYAFGINATWFFPCQSSPSIRDDDDETCIARQENFDDHDDNDRYKCFRGLHDNLVSHFNVRRALWLGRDLILEGGDHFTIHYNVSRLQESVPDVVNTIPALLRKQYYVDDKMIKPVAFRIYTTGPVDGHGVKPAPSMAFEVRPEYALNKTVREKKYPGKKRLFIF